MSEFLKKIKGYKSLAFFVLAFLVAVAGIAAPEDLQVTDDQAQWLALLVPLAGLILRALTNTPITKNEPLTPEEFAEVSAKRNNL